MSLVERMTAIGRRDQLEQYVEVRILPINPDSFKFYQCWMLFLKTDNNVFLAVSLSSMCSH